MGLSADQAGRLERAEGVDSLTLDANESLRRGHMDESGTVKDEAQRTEDERTEAVYVPPKVATIGTIEELTHGQPSLDSGSA